MLTGTRHGAGSNKRGVIGFMAHSTKRDSWGSKWGFILACIGSAVGMGNIWLFPARISKYGGATFLIPYLIFVFIIGSTGVIGEMAFGLSLIHI